MVHINGNYLTKTPHVNPLSVYAKLKALCKKTIIKNSEISADLVF